MKWHERAFLTEGDRVRVLHALGAPKLGTVRMEGEDRVIEYDNPHYRAEPLSHLSARQMTRVDPLEELAALAEHENSS